MAGDAHIWGSKEALEDLRPSFSPVEVIRRHSTMPLSQLSRRAATSCKPR
jgi:hypothetical protein